MPPLPKITSACRSAWPKQVRHPPSYRAAFTFKLQALPRMISSRRRMAKRFTISRENLERAIGIEPTTVTLARWNSTTELRPQAAGAMGRREGVAQPR